jgi:hypothetical protein
MAIPAVVWRVRRTGVVMHLLKGVQCAADHNQGNDDSSDDPPSSEPALDHATFLSPPNRSKTTRRGPVSQFEFCGRHSAALSEPYHRCVKDIS